MRRYSLSGQSLQEVFNHHLHRGSPLGGPFVHRDSAQHTLRYPIPGHLSLYLQANVQPLTSHQAATVKSYHEVRIQDLSPGESQDMVESLLKSRNVPAELKKFIQTKTEGNPFYLEEVINSLLETAALIQQDDKWLLTKPLSEANIPSTVQGVISADWTGWKWRPKESSRKPR